MDDFNIFALLAGSAGLITLCCIISINTIFSGWLAEQKGRSVGNWIALGLFFGPLALLTLGFSPNLKEEEILKSIQESLESQKINDGFMENEDLEPYKKNKRKENLHSLREKTKNEADRIKKTK